MPMTIEPDPQPKMVVYVVEYSNPDNENAIGTAHSSMILARQAAENEVKDWFVDDSEMPKLEWRIEDDAHYYYDRGQHKWYARVHIMQID